MFKNKLITTHIDLTILIKINDLFYDICYIKFKFFVYYFIEYINLISDNMAKNFDFFINFK